MLLDSVERGEWKSVKGGKRARARYSWLREGHVPLNIQVSSKDLEAIQKRALVEDLPALSAWHRYCAAFKGFHRVAGEKLA